MLAGVLAARHYWTHPLILLQETTIALLRRAMSGVVPDVGFIDGLQVCTFSLRDIFARANEIRSAPLECLYWKSDNAIKDKTVSVYHTEEGALDTTQTRGAGQEGQTYVTRFGVSRPARHLWGRPVHFHCSVGV